MKSISSELQCKFPTFIVFVSLLTFFLYVNEQDLLVTLSTLLRGSVYERLRWTFKLYDINGDGCIGRNELAKLVQAVHELMGRRPHQPDDDRKARDQVCMHVWFVV